MKEEKFLEAFHFWRNKRVTFISIVGIITVFILLSLSIIRDLTIVNVVLYALVWCVFINGLYSLGFEVDYLIIKYADDSKNRDKYRLIMFWSGTIATALLTIFIGLVSIMP